jgi:hypothetical protein
VISCTLNYFNRMRQEYILLWFNCDWKSIGNNH